MKVLHIDGRQRPDASGVASCDDFLLREEEPEDETALLSALAARPNFTPYCLDAARMIFVETPLEVDLSSGPFYYQAQHQAATRLIAVPHEQVHQLAGAIQPITERVFLYSMARSGSTLVSKMWQLLDDTLSLSEPDIFTDIQRLRRARVLGDGEDARLLGSAMAFFRKPDARRLAIKFRAQCLGLADLLYQLWPRAKLIFVYRNALDCVDSFLRVFGGAAVAEPGVRRALPEAALLGEPYYRQLGRLGRPLLLWAEGARGYLALRSQGLPVAALRYEELVQWPGPSIAAMFRHCGVDPERAQQALRAMEGDPQAGTPLARNPDGHTVLTPQEREQIHHFLQHHTGLAPDVRLEGTLDGRS